MKSKCKNRWKKGISAYDLVEYYENFYHTKSNPQSKCNSKESLRKFSQKIETQKNLNSKSNYEQNSAGGTLHSISNYITEPSNKLQWYRLKTEM